MKRKIHNLLNIKIVFDLDGTLFDSFNNVYKTDLICFEKCGLVPPSTTLYKNSFNTKNWAEMYSAINIPKNIDMQEWKIIFAENIKKLPSPILIKGSQEMLAILESTFGLSSIFFLTAENKPLIIKRLNDCNMYKYTKNLICNSSDKTNALKDLSSNTDLLIYIGDLISDGLACQEANKQVENIKFIAIGHKYSFNVSSQLKKWVNQNKDFGEYTHSLSMIPDKINYLVATMHREEYHIISPHRDDAILTFGGLILSKAKKNNVFIHLIYGVDGYIRPKFKNELEKYGANHPHIKTLHKVLYEEDNYNITRFQKIISKLQSKQALSQEEDLYLGIMIRKLEDKTIAKKAEIKIIKYDFPCGFPLRGYKNFNSNLRDKDLKEQISILTGNKKTPEKIINYVREIIGIDPNLSAPFKQLLSTVLKNNDITYNLFFPSAIGGHPDHTILTLIGQIIDKMNLSNIKVFFGQDMPYATVPEWFALSPIRFNKYIKKVVNIKHVYKQKINLLKLYKSQLSDEDIKLASVYPLRICELINRDYFVEGYNKYKEIIPIEILYTRATGR